MSAAGWFYGSASAGRGPISIEQLRQLVLSGQITPHTFVWSEGMPEWVPVGTIVHVPKGLQPDDGINVLLPYGAQSGFAIAAGYCGLLGITAPLGILFGILGLRDIAAHPRKHGRYRAIIGIVAGSLWIAGLLLVLALVLSGH